MPYEEPDLITCPLCGFKYQRKPCSGCPANSKCDTLCCPHCGYRTVDDREIRKKFLKVRSFLEWLMRKIKGR